jgi:ribosomal protein S18 acetylase RimI-like enzyme
MYGLVQITDIHSDLAAIESLHARVNDNDVFDEGDFESMYAQPTTQMWKAMDTTAPKVVGVIIFDHDVEERDVYINMLAVSEAYRCRGIASELLQKALLVQPADALVLHTHTENAIAIRFYKKMGFTITKVLKGFYSEDADAFYMTLMKRK